MNYELWIILLLLIIILILSITVLYVAKNATYLSDTSKELINFVIDMYIQYGEEINITSEDKHDIIVNKLNKLKEKLNK